MTIRDFTPPAAQTSVSRLTTAVAEDLVLVFTLVLAACLFGIGTRPAGFLAAIWPANALLLGLFIRHPKFARPAGWCTALLAYLLADLLTGSTLRQTLLLTAGNLLPVMVGYALYARLSDEDRRLKRPFSVLYLTIISAAAAASSSIVGAIAYPLFFGGSAIQGMLFWSVTEFVNFIVLLPVALTVPAPHWPRRADWESLDTTKLVQKAAPLVALVLSCMASLWIGGPGALAFPVPALLWCALVYSVSTTALITLLVSAWTLIGISAGTISLGADVAAMSSIMSVRIGVALMALAPLNVASVMAARREFQVLLQRMVTNDPLTSALTRRAFAIRARNQLIALSGTQRSVSVVVFDIDGLKTINERHGHDVGDRALKTFARTARAYLPEGDNLGRIGSDEFAILIPDAHHDAAAALASGVCAVFGETPIAGHEEKKIWAKATAGVHTTHDIPSQPERLLNAAERSLADAKRAQASAHAALATEQDASQRQGGWKPFTVISME